MRAEQSATIYTARISIGHSMVTNGYDSLRVVPTCQVLGFLRNQTAVKRRSYMKRNFSSPAVLQGTTRRYRPVTGLAKEICNEWVYTAVTCTKL